MEQPEIECCLTLCLFVGSSSSFQKTCLSSVRSFLQDQQGREEESEVSMSEDSLLKEERLDEGLLSMITG